MGELDGSVVDEKSAQLSRYIDIEQATNAILRMALTDSPLDVLLGRILDLILAIPWLSVERMGAIFLADTSENLVLAAHRHLGPEVSRDCARVSFGTCVCGKAAETQLLQYSACAGAKHAADNGQSSHGHYCVPFVADDVCLGVLALYLEPTHERDEAEEQFLWAMADAITGVIARDNVEQRRRESEARLAAIVEAYEGLLYVCSEDFTIEYINERFIELIGRNPTGETCYEAIHGLSDVCSWCTNDRVFSGESIRWEVQLKQDGRDYLVLNRPLVHADGSISKLSMSGDVTNLKQTQRRLEETVGELERALEGVVDALSSTTSQRDPYTALHQERVARLACAIARRMALEAKLISGLQTAGLLHDIGKIAVPSDILNKPGTLSDMEMGIIRTHPHVGYKLLESVPFHRPVAEAVLQHHERLDGTGYPDGLHADEIIIEARILAVADVLEAMASHRPYRPALGLEAAVAELAHLAGEKLDPDVVDAAIALTQEEGFEL